MKAVLVGRLVLLLVAAGAVVWALTLGRRHDRAASSFEHRYTCPMHREVASRAPGDCPICRMALERVGSSSADASSVATGVPSPGTTAEVGATSFSQEQAANSQGRPVTGRVQRLVVAREVNAPAWVEDGGRVAAILHTDELAGLPPDAPGLFFRSVAPTVGVPVRLVGEPRALPETSTSRASFRFRAGASSRGRVGALGNSGPPEVGWVKLAAQPRQQLVVPSGAVLTSSQGAYVLTPAADGRTFAKRPVQIGTLFGGLAVVLSGLREEEQVVVGNAFFLDAERRMRSHQEANAR